MKYELSRDQQTFIDILRDYIHAEPVRSHPDTDWETIRQYAKSHQLAAVFYYQTREPIFEPAFAYQVTRSAALARGFRDFQAVMQPFDYLTVKGDLLAQLYRAPALRSMGDIDVLIHEADREAVNQALLNAGFECIPGRESYGEYKYRKQGILYEVHDTLVHRYEGKEQLIEYFSHIWEHVQDGRLDWSFHLLYILEHIRQHFVGCGVGFRQFLDIAIVCRKCEIDWDYVARELRKLGLYDFSATVFAFIERWFDCEVPFEKKVLSEAFFLEATQKIFADGVFGADNEANSQTDLSFEMHYKGLDYRSARREYIRKLLFPPYDVMCRIPEFSYVRKHKLLLPFAWIHRFFCRIFDRKSRARLQQLSGGKVTARMDMLHQWGL